jgi:hypothetical protein
MVQPPVYMPINASHSERTRCEENELPSRVTTLPRTNEVLNAIEIHMNVRRAKVLVKGQPRIDLGLKCFAHLRR